MELNLKAELKLWASMLAIASLGIVAALSSAQGFEEKTKSRSLRDMIKLSPSVKAFVEKHMATETPKTPTYDQAVADTEAKHKACTAKCTAGAASAKLPNGKGSAAELAKCVDKKCQDECDRMEVLWHKVFDSHIKGMMGESMEMEMWMKSKVGAEIWHGESVRTTR